MITDELKELQQAASFTIADMAVWCEHNRSAIRQWLLQEHEPHPIKARYLKEKLDVLRWALKNLSKLPVPATINFHERAKYVEQVRDYALKEFSKSGAAKRGV